MGLRYFIVFGKYKKATSFEDVNNQYSEFKKVLAKHNLKLLFYGAPFGQKAQAVYVVEGEVNDWEKSIIDMEFQTLNPLTDKDTIMVYDFTNLGAIN